MGRRYTDEERAATDPRTEITFALCLGVVLSAAMGGLLPLAVCAAASFVWPVEEA